MLGVTAENPLKINIFSSEIRQNFQSYCANWAVSPPFYVEHDGIIQIVVGRHRDVTEISADRSRFSVELPRRAGVEKYDSFMGMDVIAQIDGEKHDRLRRLIQPPFNPAGVRKLEGTIRRHVVELLDLIDAKGLDEIDFMAEFADRIMPIIMLEGMFQIDRAKWPIFIRMSGAIDLTEEIEAGGEFPEIYTDALAATRAAVDDIVSERRAKPGDDLISQLVAVRDGTDKLNDAEMFAQIFTLVAGAFSSTASALGAIFLTFGRHPEQYELVAADPGLIPQAIEECLRIHPTGYGTFPRFAVADTDVGGTRIKAGVAILPCLAAANYDPDAYPDPMRFDVRRNPKGVTTYGATGVHACVGSQLARTVQRIVLQEMTARFPKLSLADPEFQPVYRGHLTAAHCATLPLRLR
jgi:cytochrome P450